MSAALYYCVNGCRVALRKDFKNGEHWLQCRKKGEIPKHTSECREKINDNRFLEEVEKEVITHNVRESIDQQKLSYKWCTESLLINPLITPNELFQKAKK